MSQTLNSPRHEALRALIVEERQKAGLTQNDVAKCLRRYQSFVAYVESGQRRIDVVEFLAFAEAIGFDARLALTKLIRVNQSELKGRTKSVTRRRRLK